MLTEKWRLIPAFLHSCGKITGCPGLSRECAAVLEDDEVVCKLWVVRVLLPPVAHLLREFFCIADCCQRFVAAGHCAELGVRGRGERFVVDFVHRYRENETYVQTASSGFALRTSCPHINIGGRRGTNVRAGPDTIYGSGLQVSARIPSEKRHTMIPRCWVMSVQ